MLYGQAVQQEKKEKSLERRELKLGGKGQGKTGKKGRKSTPKRHVGQAHVTSSVAARRQGWQDPEVIRALTGGKPSGALSETDSDAVVPHSARVKRPKKQAQQVLASKAVQDALEAAQKATQAQKNVTK